MGERILWGQAWNFQKALGPQCPLADAVTVSGERWCFGPVLEAAPLKKYLNPLKMLTLQRRDRALRVVVRAMRSKDSIGGERPVLLSDQLFYWTEPMRRG